MLAVFFDMIAKAPLILVSVSFIPDIPIHLGTAVVFCPLKS